MAVSALFLGLAGLSGAALVVGKATIPKFNFVPEVASVGGFTIYTVTSGYPAFHASSYQLRIDGMVDRPLTMTIDDILKHRAVTERRYYQCVTGWKVPDATWTGIPLYQLLDRVGPRRTGETARRIHGETHPFPTRSSDLSTTEIFSRT